MMTWFEACKPCTGRRDALLREIESINERRRGFEREEKQEFNRAIVAARKATQRVESAPVTLYIEEISNRLRGKYPN